MALDLASAFLLSNAISNLEKVNLCSDHHSEALEAGEFRIKFALDCTTNANVQYADKIVSDLLLSRSSEFIKAAEDDRKLMKQRTETAAAM